MKRGSMASTVISPSREWSPRLSQSAGESCGRRTTWRARADWIRLICSPQAAIGRPRSSRCVAGPLRSAQTAPAPPQVGPRLRRLRVVRPQRQTARFRAAASLQQPARKGVHLGPRLGRDGIVPSGRWLEPDPGVLRADSCPLSLRVHHRHPPRARRRRRSTGGELMNPEQSRALIAARGCLGRPRCLGRTTTFRPRTSPGRPRARRSPPAAAAWRPRWPGSVEIARSGG